MTILPNQRLRRGIALANSGGSPGGGSGAMETQAILEKVEGLLVPILGHMGYELIERELAMGAGRWVLRLYVDKPGGVSIDDCAQVSRGIEDVIEVEGVIPQAYALEVSSPGINRPLRRRQDFERFSGQLIRLRTVEPLGGRSNFKGMLERLEGDEIVMEVDGRHYRIPYGLLAKARLEEEIVPLKTS